MKNFFKESRYTQFPRRSENGTFESEILESVKFESARASVQGHCYSQLQNVEPIFYSLKVDLYDYGLLPYMADQWITNDQLTQTGFILLKSLLTKQNKTVMIHGL